MRLLLAAIIALSLSGCASSQRGGLSTGRTIPAAERHAVLVRLADAERGRVPVPGTGAAMQPALEAALRAAGFTLTVIDAGTPDALAKAVMDSGARLVLSARFIEWGPDMRLALDASEPGTFEAVSAADVVIGSMDIGEARRVALLRTLADRTVERLLMPQVSRQFPSGR